MSLYVVFIDVSIRAADGRWVRAPTEPGYFLVNCGDVLRCDTIRPPICRILACLSPIKTHMKRIKKHIKKRIKTAGHMRIETGRFLFELSEQTPCWMRLCCYVWMFRGSTGGGQITGGFLHCTAPRATPRSRAVKQQATAQQAGVSHCLCSSTRSSHRSSKPFRAASGLLRNALTTKHTRFPIQNRPSTCRLPYYYVIYAGRLPRQAQVSSNTRLTDVCVGMLAARRSRTCTRT